MIKFLHCADLHLGRTFHDLSLAADQRFVLDQIIEILRDPSYRALIIAGDVYDRSIPSPEAVRLFSSFLGTLRSHNSALEIMVIPGNHDSPARLGFGRELFAELGIHFAGEPEESFEPVVLRDSALPGGGEGTPGTGDCAFFLLPFLNPGSLSAGGKGPREGGGTEDGVGEAGGNSAAEDDAGDAGAEGDGGEPGAGGPIPGTRPGAAPAYPGAMPGPAEGSAMPGEALRSQAQLAAEAARRLDLSRRRWAERGVTRAVLAAHLFAGGGRESESERIFLGGAEKVDMGLFAGFDYVALGHLHRFQRAGANGWYAGSPLAYSFAEGDTEKVVLSVELGAPGTPLPAGNSRDGDGLTGSTGGADEVRGAGSAEARAAGSREPGPAGEGGGAVRVTPIPLRPRYRVRRLAGPFDRFNRPSPQDTELREAAGDYLEFSLSDSSLTENALPILQSRYPRLLSVKQETARRGLAALYAGSRPAGPAPAERRDTAADFEEFLTGLYGEAAPEKMNLFRELLAQVEAEEREAPDPADLRDSPEPPEGRGNLPDPAREGGEPPGPGEPDRGPPGRLGEDLPL